MLFRLHIIAGSTRNEDASVLFFRIRQALHSNVKKTAENLWFTGTNLSFYNDDISNFQQFIFSILPGKLEELGQGRIEASVGRSSSGHPS